MTTPRILVQNHSVSLAALTRKASAFCVRLSELMIAIFISLNWTIDCKIIHLPLLRQAPRIPKLRKDFATNTVGDYLKLAFNYNYTNFKLRLIGLKSQWTHLIKNDKLCTVCLWTHFRWRRWRCIHPYHYPPLPSILPLNTSFTSYHYPPLPALTTIHPYHHPPLHSANELWTRGPIFRLVATPCIAQR